VSLFVNRFPNRGDVIAVLGVAVFLCHTWTIIGFLNKLSSFILYFSPGTIAGVFAYMMAFALLESLAVTGFLVLLSVLLPSQWLKEGFSIKGFIVLVVAATASILFQKTLSERFPSMWVLLASSVVPLLLIALLFVAVRSMPKVKNLFLNVQDRILIMLFIYVPIGVLSLMVVLYRNLL
jgi:hypothetical protein